MLKVSRHSYAKVTAEASSRGLVHSGECSSTSVQICENRFHVEHRTTHRDDCVNGRLELWLARNDPANQTRPELGGERVARVRRGSGPQYVSRHHSSRPPMLLFHSCSADVVQSIRALSCSQHGGRSLRHSRTNPALRGRRGGFRLVDRQIPRREEISDAVRSAADEEPARARLAGHSQRATRRSAGRQAHCSRARLHGCRARGGRPVSCRWRYPASVVLLSRHR